MNIDNYNDEINLNDPTIIFDDNNSYSYIANKSDEFENDDGKFSTNDGFEYQEEETEIRNWNDFYNYELAERFLDQYAKSNGFVIIKGRIEKDKTDKSIIVRRSFECHHERIRKSKKVIDFMQQRN
ncbi:hypothetical protein GLOIN_2v1779818 [Rhizophagus irregularis DAOM 181602=DAOM 197198]|uniref:FAR1 domain-containing protein n=1 Tax=Rhizophagus irregularis (strain DAOM 181602 / DAOM 197198 / MUCL 43194) TaxID=747089 RepID=U9SRJ9_RHIID|nr:hypothetical protein GLOIN_2v1779818 [Rhizophagus irregularis DAOM 181602=DAOM 197198]